MDLGVPLKGSKLVLMGLKSYFAHKNILFEIFAPGAVPRSSALCLFLFYFIYNYNDLTIIQKYG